MPEKLFTFGVRAGVNTSNLSDNRSSAISDLKLARNQWKAGFTIGAVADINIRNFLVLQPGFFIQTRNHDYSYTMVGEGRDYWGNIEGNRSSSYIQIPILASLRKDFTEELQVQVDFGPYFMYGIGGEDEQNALKQILVVLKAKNLIAIIVKMTILAMMVLLKVMIGGSKWEPV